ncbi:Acid-sensing ion channel 4-A [Dirofilaria immitis]
MSTTTDETYRFQARLVGGNFIELPVEQLRRIANANGVDSIEQETKHFSYSTTLHGPLRLYKGKGFGKVFWCSVMCCAAVFLSLQINILIAYFISRPTVTSVTFVPAEVLPLPAITVCNYNPITKSYIHYLNESSSGAGYFTNDLLRYMTMAYSEVEDLYLHANNDTIERGRQAYEYFQSIFTEYPFNIENFFAQAGFTCHEMLKVCSVGGTKLDCCAMSQKVLTDLGLCFVFSLDHIKLNQTQPGIFNGLQLILDAGINDTIAVNYAEEGNTLPIFSNNLEDGFRLYVRSEDELAYSYTEGLSVSPVYRAYIALNLETFHFLTPENWGNCTNTWPLKSPERAFRLPYTAQNCASLCQQIYYEQRINCTPLLYSVGDAHLNTCTPSELHSFMLEVADRTNNINGPECADNICPTSCITHRYKASITYGYGFSESAMDWLTNINNNWTRKRIKENFAVVNIFYREMSYLLNEQMQSTSLVDVLSNIGGNMGLFFGASVITVIELVIFLSKLAWIAFSSRRREYMFYKRQKERDRERRLTTVIDIATHPRRSCDGIIRNEKKIVNHVVNTI